MLNVRSSDPYWLLRSPALYDYQSLKENLKADVVVIGAGISGALAAYELTRAGCKVTVISSERVGTSSTCASTSLLQYEIDTPLTQLKKKVGEEIAARSYLLCHQSIDALQKTHKAVGAAEIFHKRKSLLLSSKIKDVPVLEMEFEAITQLGIKSDWLTQTEIENKFGFTAPGAIYSDQGAETNAYLFTQQIIKWCVKQGAVVYDKTEITDLQSHKRHVELKTQQGYSINARHVVMAAGYDAVQWINLNIARLHSTYVIISEPFKKEQLWKDECLIWETARPYTYLRTTPDHRIIVGGKDEPFLSPGKRDALINHKSKQLLKAFKAKFPALQFNIENAWAGTFGETRDGLPFIGTIKKMPLVYFSLGYGGNGITFSQIAARIITDAITGKRNGDALLFGFNRLNYI